MSVRILEGDALQVLQTLPDCSVQMCVTSPPYFGLRDYGVVGQLGLEKTPDLYVEAMVGVFREVKRVLRDDGTLWLNIGDSYAREGGRTAGVSRHWDGRVNDPGGLHNLKPLASDMGLKAKDLVGVPWMLAFALRADGWYLRSDIIWAKPNPMPESVTDRPTKSHEYLFLLSKNPTYFYDAAAIAEESQDVGTVNSFGNKNAEARRVLSLTGNMKPGVKYETKPTRNKRSVWTVNPTPYSEAHFATFPPKLIEPCILAGSAKGQTVLDPFGGAGTTGLVADRLGRDALLIELNPKYAEMARRRIHSDNPLFGDVA